MKKKIITTAVALGLGLATFGGAVDAKGGPPAGTGERGTPAGVQCQQAGIGTLQTLGLLPAVARGGIEVVGIGIVPFRDVLSLHRSSPELFQTGGVSVKVGDAVIPATWCD